MKKRTYIAKGCIKKKKIVVSGEKENTDSMNQQKIVVQLTGQRQQYVCACGREQ